MQRGRFFPGREERRDYKADSPFRRPARTFSVNFRAEGKLHRHCSDLGQLADCKIDRHGPLLRVPVVSRFRIHAESCVAFGGVRNERLKKRGADVVAVLIAGIIPDVIRQDAVGPTANLFQQQSSRTEAPLFRA